MLMRAPLVVAVSDSTGIGCAANIDALIPNSLVADFNLRCCIVTTIGHVFQECIHVHKFGKERACARLNPSRER